MTRTAKLERARRLGLLDAFMSNLQHYTMTSIKIAQDNIPTESKSYNKTPQFVALEGGNA